MSKDLLDYTIRELLEKFGAGKHKPGSGSAAAMLGLISCKMTQTVIKLSIERSSYQNVRQSLIDIRNEIGSEIEPVLMESLNKDSIQFDKVIQARRLRNKEKNYIKKSKLEDTAFEELRLATEIPIAIAEMCIQLTRNALKVFDIGFQSARGDSAVAISSALSGASGAISIVYLNLVSFWGDEWALKTIKETDILDTEVNKLRKQLYRRINALKEEVEVSNGRFELDLNKFILKKDSGKSFDYRDIEQQVRKLQNTLWDNRRNIWKENVPRELTEVLQPEVAVKSFGYNFYKGDSLGESEQDGERFEVAGLFNPKESTVSISSQFSLEVQNFTAAHELGHLVLHNDQLTLHRDRPLNGETLNNKKNTIEIEADKFATFFLMPRKEVERVFVQNFRSKVFTINQDTAFALGENSLEDLRKKYPTEIELSRRLSKETVYMGS